VVDQQIVRVLDLLHCPWILPAASSVVVADSPEYYARPRIPKRERAVIQDEDRSSTIEKKVEMKELVLVMLSLLATLNGTAVWAQDFKYSAKLPNDSFDQKSLRYGTKEGPEVRRTPKNGVASCLRWLDCTVRRWLSRM
jgi:hypothetical protein